MMIIYKRIIIYIIMHIYIYTEHVGGFDLTKNKSGNFVANSVNYVTKNSRECWCHPQFHVFHIPNTVTMLAGWWFQPLNMSQLGWLFPIYGKIKNVPKPPTTWQIYQNIQKHSKTWGVPNNGGGTPKAGWFIMKNPTIKRMIWGYPHDLGNLHIQKDITTTRWGLMILLSFEHHLLIEKWQESHQNWNWAEKKTQ